MFIGHFGVALAAKKIAPKVSLGTLMLAAGFAAAYYAFTRHARGAWVVGVLVISHWILDFFSHRPDLPLLPTGGPRVGLGLWNHLGATLAIETAIFLGGVWVYTRVTRARDRVGTWGAGFVPGLAVHYLSGKYPRSAATGREGDRARRFPERAVVRLAVLGGPASGSTVSENPGFSCPAAASPVRGHATKPVCGGWPCH